MNSFDPEPETEADDADGPRDNSPWNASMRLSVPILGFALVLTGCLDWSVREPEIDSDADSGGDGDADADQDADLDAGDAGGPDGDADADDDHDADLDMEEDHEVDAESSDGDADGDGETCVPGFCSAHGSCDDSSGVPECTCAPPYAGPHCEVEIDFVSITGGPFSMGTDEGEAVEAPPHDVTLGDFEIARTETTVGQYRACVDAGACTAPTITDERCNWDSGRGHDHPQNCLLWREAHAFCAFVGGRLPSEAEWEFAAQSRGRDILYPWGDTPPTCSLVVMDLDGVPGCGTEYTMTGCSISAGNTDQGLCDMAGNVWEWVEDDWHWDYVGAPTDGSAWVGEPRSPSLVFRGGSFAADAYRMRTTCRNGTDPFAAGLISIGFRCTR